MKPKPGDAVLYTADEPYIGVKKGQIAIIDGHWYDDKTCLICFAYSAFKGKASKYSEHGEYVSCSGGPLPLVAHKDLKPTGKKKTITFWRWKDYPRAGGGEYYQEDVTLWEWNGTFSKDIIEGKLTEDEISNSNG